jgi:hypothetical protein
MLSKVLTICISVSISALSRDPGMEYHIKDSGFDSDFELSGVITDNRPFGTSSFEKTLCAISIPLCRESSVSRLPKALFRELNGRCSDRLRKSHHQIMSHGPPWESPLESSSKSPGESDRPQGFVAVYSPIAAYLTLVGLAVRLSSTSCVTFVRWRAKAGCSNLNDSIAKLLREKPIDTKMTIFPFGSSADTRGFREGRQGSRERPDRLCEWNRQRCYKVHPYWTSNLKYVV